MGDHGGFNARRWSACWELLVGMLVLTISWQHGIHNTHDLPPRGTVRGGRDEYLPYSSVYKQMPNLTPSAAFEEWFNRWLGTHGSPKPDLKEAWLAGCKWQKEQDAALAKAKCACGLNESCAWCKLAVAIRTTNA